MEYKNDFIEREIQKVILVLKSTILAVQNLGEDFSLVIFDKTLKGQLDIGFFELLHLNAKDLESKLENLDILVLDELVSLFYEIHQKGKPSDQLRSIEIVSFCMLLIIEKKSNIFSFKRQLIKNYFKSVNN